MKPGIPWSVKGIGDDAREAAKQAARRSGMTLGEWLNSVILGQADTPAPQDERQTYRQAPARHPSAYSGRDDFNSKLDDIAAQLARLAEREQDTTAGNFHEPSQEAEADREIINEILARLDNNERVTAEAFEVVQTRLATIDEHIAQPAPPPAFPDKPEDVPGYQALESALRNIVDHIETSEKRSRETLKTVQDRIAEVVERAASADSERIQQTAPVIARLEDRLADVGMRLEDRLADVVMRLERTEAATEHALPSLVENEVTRLSERLDAVPDLVTGEIGRLTGRIETVRQNSDQIAGRVEAARHNFDQLAGRIETVRQTSEQLAQTAKAEALQAAQSELREIEGRIQGALKDTQSAMRAANPVGDIQRLRSDMESLNQRIDDLKADAASDREVHSLKAAMEQLSARVAQGPDLRPLADMDRRLADITRRIEQNQGTARLEPQLSALERRVYELDQRLAEAMLHQQDSRAVDALERQISAVSDRLGQTEHQLSHLDTLENSINQLFQSLEQSRNAAREIAEDAASRMADRVLQSYPQVEKAAAPTPSPELVALEQGLEAVRASANVADQRNQETLEAVHETLEQIVNKIAELEVSGIAVPGLTHPPASAWQDTVAAQAQHEAHPQPLEPEAADPFTYVPTPIPEPAAPLHHIEEPAPAVSADLGIAPPADSEAGLAGEAFKPDDFIAAARRAAQAAARQPPGPIASSMGFLGRAKAKTTKAAKGPSRFSLPFLSQEKRKAAAAEKEAAENAEKPTDKRKRLILAGLVLLAAVSAYAFSSLGRGQLTAALETAGSALKDKAAVAVGPAAQKAPLPAPEAKSSKADALAKDEILAASWTAGSARAAQVSEEAIPETIGSEGLRKAAMDGDPNAQFIVAGRFLEGKSVEQDFAAAARWYQKSAAKGLAPAQYRIGTLFERGKGVPQDVTLARVWYERAAGRGNVKAMHNAAVIFAGSEAGDPDYAKAARWFTEAGDHGLKDSQYNLAVLYERGLGVKQDAGEALYWYSLAAQQNDGDARQRAASLERMLAPSTVASVRDRVRTFALLKEKPEANVVAVADPAWQNDAPPAMAQAIPYEMPVLGAVVDMSAVPHDPVAEAQGLLNDLGYDIGTPDGRMGTRTANAIRLFQLQAGMKVTGEVTDDLVIKLRAKKG